MAKTQLDACSQANQVMIYQTDSGDIKVEVAIHDETVWLTQQQIADLFVKDRTVITKHINKILEEQELDESVCALFAHTASDGKTYNTKYYNLDMIISVGYRVNSKRGIQFRRWASKILKDQLIKGYSINHDKVLKDNLVQLKQTIELLSNSLVHYDLVNETGKELVRLIEAYSKTWDILVKYDNDNLAIPINLQEGVEELLTYQEAIQAISILKNELVTQESTGISGLFGAERENIFKGILGNIDQTFDGISLYKSAEEKAAHLLYFIIKDHPFNDGNKRIASFLFLLYLRKAKIEMKMMNAHSMTSLTLLIAESNPIQKELMTKLIINLISEK